MIVLKTFGESMLPLLQDKDSLFIKKNRFQSIKINDIVTVFKDKKYFTHRVIYKTRKYLITKGDNSVESDGKVYTNQIVGKVIEIKRRGKIINPQDLYLIQSTLYFQEIVKIKKILEKLKIPFVILKGLPLHLYFEKSHPQRLYLDSDMLCQRKHQKMVEEILKKNGYKPHDTSLSKTQKKMLSETKEVSFYKRINDITVVFDIHYELVFLMTQVGNLNALYPKKNIEQFTNKAIIESQKISLQGETFPILKPHHLITYLALHFFHHSFRGVFRLEFLDRIIRRYSKNNWSRIEKLIIDFQLQNFVYPVFLLLKKYFKTPLPQSFLNKIRPSFTARLFIKHNVLGKSVFDGQSRIDAGITRFKNLFFLSPRPIIVRLGIIFNLQVLYTIFWTIKKKLYLLFANR